MIYTDGTHLVADTLHELHTFADKIGLKREWFQEGRHPHYDFTSKRKMFLALRYGAKKIKPKGVVRITRKLRKEWAASVIRKAFANDK